jgi:exodeoxyribonuclease III
MNYAFTANTTNSISRISGFVAFIVCLRIRSNIMKLISWNVNGIRAAVKNGFLDFLNSEKPDVLGLQEIKISHEARLKTEFDFRNYEEYWNPAERPGYSGTAVFESQKSEVRSQKYFDEFPNDEEGRVQTLEFDKFFFINAYFPNANHELSRLDFKIDFNRRILEYVKELENKKPVVVCGDFNVAHEEIDLKNPKENMGNAGFTYEERAWMTNFLNSGLVDTFRHFHPDRIQYSWWSYRFRARERNIGWRIDYFLVSKSLLKHVKKAFIMDRVKGSDHCPVGIEIDI